MKIAFLVPDSGGVVSGGYLYDARIAAGLRARGHDVHVLQTPRRLPQIEELRQVARSIDGTCDIILQDELAWSDYEVVNRLLDARGCRTRRIAIVHVPACLLDPATNGRAEREYLDSVNGAIFVSETTFADTRERIGVPIPHVIVNPGRAEVAGEPRQPSDDENGVPAGATRLITVANLSANKGVLELVDVMRRLAEHVDPSRWHLTVVGDTQVDMSITRAVQRLIHRSGLQESVRLTGRQTPAQVAAHLAASDIYLLSSYYESYGMACVEALAHGLPVVSWSAGGPWEFLSAGANALRVARGDLDGFAQTVAQLIEAPATCFRLGIGARASWVRLPTWEQACARFESALFAYLQTSSEEAAFASR